MKRIIGELTHRKKTQYLELMEFIELTERLAEAVQRRDEVAAKIFLAMREEPLARLGETEDRIRTMLEDVSDEDGFRLRRILNGTEENVSGGLTAEEVGLREAARRCAGLLRRASELDETVSLSMHGKRSFYSKFR